MRIWDLLGSTSNYFKSSPYSASLSETGNYCDVIGACLPALYFLATRTTRAANNNTPSTAEQKPPTPEKELKTRQIQVIEIPDQVTTSYQGSNAEYIVFKQNGAELNEEEYVTSAVPILRLQFPRTQVAESTLSPEELTQLNKDEVAYIDTALKVKGLVAIKIPKTLYDIFYLAFRFEVSAQVPEQGDACEFAGSLTRFLRPAAEISRYQPNLCVTEEALDYRFQKIDAKHVVSKIDFALNQYILHDLTQKGLSNRELSWTEMASLVDTLSQRIIEIRKKNEAILNALYTQQCPSTICKKKGDYQHYNHYVFRMARNFPFPRPDTPQRISTPIKRALYQEYSQKASLYTLYRGANLSTDYIKQSDTNYDNVHSLSYGQSLCSSCELDMGGAGAIPLEYMREHGHGYTLTIDKNDYYKGNTKNLFIIPPAQRTARFRLNGEFTHARSRVYPKANTSVKGMGNFEIEKVPYIVTQGKFQSSEAFDQIVSDYLDQHGREIYTTSSTS
jgi:hypothetical protein